MVAIKQLSVAALVWLGLASQGLALGIDEATNDFALVERNDFEHGPGAYARELGDIETRGPGSSPPSTPKSKPKKEPKISPKGKQPSNIRQQVHNDAVAMANQRHQRREYLELLARGPGSSPPSTPKSKPKKEPKISPKGKQPSNIRQQVHNDAVAMANQRHQRREYLELLARGPGSSPPSTPKSKPKKDPKISPQGNKGTNRNEQQRQQDAAHALIGMANGRQRRAYLNLLARAPPTTPPQSPRRTQPAPKISPKNKQPSNIRQQVHNDAVAMANQRHQRREFLELLARAPPTTPPQSPRRTQPAPKISPKGNKGTNRNEQQRQQDAAHALIGMANGRQRRAYLNLLARAPPTTPPQSPRRTQPAPKISPKGNKGTNRNEQQRQQDAAHALIGMANGGHH